MEMSYKRAWDLVDEINRICRQAAVERQTGGKNGGGAVLTPFGRSLVARYRKIERPPQPRRARNCRHCVPISAGRRNARADHKRKVCDNWTR
jgi:N-terminal domain of molybdenum-binding protein